MRRVCDIPLLTFMCRPAGNTPINRVSAAVHGRYYPVLGRNNRACCDTPRRKNVWRICCDAGLPDAPIHFQNLPLSETGQVRKKPIAEDDIRLTMDLLDQVQPQQVYAADDLSDPHGTHRVYLAAFFEAIRRLKEAEVPWLAQCRVRLYRGAWQERDVDQLEIAVPFSPQELTRKRRAIFTPQNQKDRTLFPGANQRGFWQRAEECNRTTARLYHQFGLPEYGGTEVFVRWHFWLFWQPLRGMMENRLSEHEMSAVRTVRMTAG